MRHDLRLTILAPVAIWALAFAEPAQATDTLTLTAEQPEITFPFQWEGGVLHVETHTDTSCANWSQATAPDTYLILRQDGAVVAQDDDGNHNADTDCLASKLHLDLPAGSYTLSVQGCCSRLYGTLRLDWQQPEPATTTSTTTSTTATTSTTTTTTSTTTTTTVAPTTTTEEPTSTTTEASTTTTSTLLPTTEPSSTTSSTVLRQPASSVPTQTTSTLPISTTSTSTPTSVPEEQSPASEPPSTSEPETQVEELLAEAADDGITPEEAAQIIAAVQNAPESVRQQFEAEADIYSGAFDEYVPLGSAVPVRTRRTIIAVATALTVPIAPRRRL